MAAEQISAADYIKTQWALTDLRARALAALRDVDALLVPTTMIPAVPVAVVDASLEVYAQHNMHYLRNTSIGNGLGLCGLSVPCGFTAAGLPIGLMVYAKPFQETMALRIGHAFQQATDWHRRTPDLPISEWCCATLSVVVGGRRGQSNSRIWPDGEAEGRNRSQFRGGNSRSSWYRRMEQLEQLVDLPGDFALAVEPFAPRGTVELSSPRGSDGRQDLLLAERPRSRKPFPKDGLHALREPQERVAGSQGPCRLGRLQNRGYFRVVEAGDDRRHGHTDRHTGVGQQPHRPQSRDGDARPRLHRPRQFRVERGEGQGNADQSIGRKRLEQIEVPGDQRVLGDDADGLAVGQRDGQALARKVKRAPRRLETVGHAGKRDRLRFPGVAGQKRGEQPRARQVSRQCASQSPGRR